MYDEPEKSLFLFCLKLTSRPVGLGEQSSVQLNSKTKNRHKNDTFLGLFCPRFFSAVGFSKKFFAAFLQAFIC
jgi:hypothetical protein